MKKKTCTYPITLPVFFFYIVLLFFLLLPHCNDDKTVLGSYKKDGATLSINRQELGWLLSLQANGDFDGKKPSTDVQQKVLKSYLRIQIAYNKIEQKKIKEEIENSPIYKNRSLLLEERMKLAAYETFLREEKEGIRYEFIEPQLVYLAFPKNETSPQKGGTEKMSKKIASYMKKTNEILSQLNSSQLTEQDKEKKIYQISEHPRYRLQGGYIDPICTSCATNPFSEFIDALEKVEMGKFVQIRQPNSIWLLRVVKKYTIEKDQIEDRFETFYGKTTRIAKKYIKLLPEGDPSQSYLKQIALTQKQIEDISSQKAKRISQNEKKNLIFSKINKLKKKNKYILHKAGNVNLTKTKEEKITYKDDTPLYSINGKKYLYDQLRKNFTATKESLSKIDQQLQLMHNIIIPLALLEKEESFQKNMRSDLYKFIRDFIQKQILVTAYYTKKRNEIKISASDIQAKYQTYKNGRYADISKKIALDNIRKEMQQTTFTKWLQEEQKKETKKYNLIIQNDLLQID